MDFIYQQLVYFGFLQGIFLLLIYLVSPRQRAKINGFLAFFVGVLVLGLSGRILYLSGIFGDNYRVVILSEMATLLFGPTIYLFTRSSLRGEHFRAGHLWHYLPGMIYNVAILFVFVFPDDEVLRLRTERGAQFRIILLMVGLGLVHNITYWTISLRVFLRVRKTLPDELSHTVKSRFFLNFLLAIGLCLLGWLTLYLFGLFRSPVFQRPPWQLVWLSLACILLFITYYGLTEPELYQVAAKVQAAPVPEPRKYTKSKLSAADLDALKLRLELLMEERKPYLNRKLMKAELAALLGVSKPEISRLLNEKIGMTFFEYINHFRIKEFIALAHTERAVKLTLYGLAQEAGFNSKTTFNKAFRELMGTSPTVYFRENGG